MFHKAKNLPPEPYFSGYLTLLYRVLISLRVRTASPEKMSQDELVSLVKDIHYLTDALHNVPEFLREMDDWSTPERMEDIYIGGYDDHKAIEEGGFSLKRMLRDCIEERRKTNKTLQLTPSRGASLSHDRLSFPSTSLQSLVARSG